jgi:hypothetical protein
MHEAEARAVADHAYRPGSFVTQNALPLIVEDTIPSTGDTKTFLKEETFWKESVSLGLSSVCLKEFRLSDWFPRAPGVYWSTRAIIAREQSDRYGKTTNDPELGLIYNPRGKMALVEDGGLEQS